ncbi:ankyrin repeat-containing domain protein [Halenospora varia]|nr:ankyrin repeat-containing domain protein [Halenospora varia]
MALHRASEHGHLEIVRDLLEAKSLIDQKDCDDNTPLVLAASKGCTSIVVLLLDAGSDITAFNRLRNTALHAAVCGHHVKTVQALVERGSKIGFDSKDNFQELKAEDFDTEELGSLTFTAQSLRGYSPLTIAATRGYDDIVRLFLHAETQVNANKTYKLDLMLLWGDLGGTVWSHQLKES